ncbi:MAG TPA: hypothetical protein P5110_06895 [Candidatus Omnitrophota bacterium]|nr:hypothetical protein [Candidatus Omnitrophota bacterium]
MGWFHNTFGFSSQDVAGKAADTVREVVDPVLPEAAKKFGTDTIQHAGSWAPQTVGAAFTAAGMPFIGMPIAGLGGAISNYQDTGNYGKAAISGLGAAATAYGGGNLLKAFGTKMASPAVAKGAGNAAAALGSSSPASSISAAPTRMPSLASEFGAQQVSQFGTGLPATGLGNPAPQLVTPLAQQFAAQQAGQVPGAAATVPSVGGSTIATTPTTAAKSSSSLWEKFVGKPESWQRTATSAAIPLLGSAFGPKAQTWNPEQSALFNDVTERVKSGNMVQLTDAQKQAITATYDEQYDQALTNLKQRYKALRPGSDIENDSQFRRDMQDLEEDYAVQKANALTMAQWNFTQDQTEMLSQLASLDIYSLAQAAQISVQEANAFKSMLGDIGFMVAGVGNSGIGALASMFGGR